MKLRGTPETYGEEGERSWEVGLQTGHEPLPKPLLWSLLIWSHLYFYSPGTGGEHWACRSAMFTTRTISSVIPSGAGLGTNRPSSCSMGSLHTRICGSVWSRYGSRFFSLNRVSLSKEKGVYLHVMLSAMMESQGNPELWLKSS